MADKKKKGGKKSRKYGRKARKGHLIRAGKAGRILTVAQMLREYCGL